MEHYVFSAGTAVVTGAAGGIGGQLAYTLAQRGSALILVDRDAERLELVAKNVRTRAERPVATYVVDLADDAAAHDVAARIAEFDWLLAINLRAVITFTRALLPVLRANPGSHLVNVSSLFGLIAPAGQVAYSTSKFAVRGFSEGLRAELAGRVGVTVVHPGGIRTGIAANSRVAAAVSEAEEREGKRAFAKLLTFPPEKAAALIVAAIENRGPRLLIAPSAHIVDVLARMTPAHYPAILEAFMRRRARSR
jgi:short-subunit dehydrogenase